MNKYHFRNQWLTTAELSELCGIAPATLRDRLRRGYTIEEAVKESPTAESIQHFADASWYQDWIGMAVSDVYDIYWRWCISNKYTPLHLQGFSRQLLRMYPNLKTVPTKRGSKNQRVIRMRG